uniref:Uncharacterized protein n=1 Tax=Anguilla anguilla TaxID=7936 RepID=A0A0E9X116_ANGAN
MNLIFTTNGKRVFIFCLNESRVEQKLKCLHINFSSLTAVAVFSYL